MRYFHKDTSVKRKILTFIMVLITFFFTACGKKKGNEIQLTILHLNDIYEITPVSGGTQGGLARVATLKKQLLAKNPNTYITLSGDIYGPSGLSNAAIVNGKPLAGEHMVAILNKVGIDYFTFGDHEFDQFAGDQVLQRMKETKFPIVTSNYAGAEGKPFKQSNAKGETIDIAKNAIFTVKDKTGKSMRVGVFGVAKQPRKEDVQMTYTEWEKAAAEQVSALKGGENPVDILIALTHLSLENDKILATKFPKIDLILGGDEHAYNKEVQGDGIAPIYKSDSNARHNYIIDLFYNPATKKLRIEDRVELITDKIADDPEVLAEVNKWLKIGFNALRKQGIKPEAVIGKAPYDLDGFATSIRTKQNKFTNLILNGMKDITKADISLLGAGIMRLDDKIPAGSNVTEFDSVRTFPMDGEIVSVQMKGSGIKGLLDTGQTKKGAGDFVLYSDNITHEKDGKWLVNGKPLDENKTYLVGTFSLLVGIYSKSSGLLVAFPDGKLSKNTGISIRQVMNDGIAKAQENGKEKK